MSGTRIPASSASVSQARINESGVQGRINTDTQKAVHAAAVDLPSGSGEKTVPARTVFLQTAAALGFPKDGLSVALLAFARFFSFSLNAEQMGGLRREILALGKQSDEKAAMEAKTLAAFIALDKGVALNPEALKQYASFFAPPVFPGDSKEENPRFSDPAFTGPGDKKNPEDLDDLPSADKIKAIAGEQAQKDGLLDYLNVLPGKNGQYWTVYPFNISVRGTVLKVFLRLLKREPSSQREAEYLIADIAGPKRQWRCFLGRNSGKLRADIRVFPEMSAGELEILSKEAELFMGLSSAGNAKGAIGNFGGFEEIIVRNGGEVPSWVENLCDESLLSIDKEV